MIQPSKEEYEICEKLKNVQMKRKEKSRRPICQEADGSELVKPQAGTGGPAARPYHVRVRW